MSVRVRYAPSPTGWQHIGGVRTALFNYLYAKKNGGDFILRVEDTDRERSDDRYIDDLYSSLSFLGIEWDEGPDKGGNCGPYVQSKRKSLYAEKSRQLLDAGHLYPCFCTAERLEALREEQKKSKAKQQGYDRLCRSLPQEEIEKRIAAGEKHVLRFKIPEQGKTAITDLLLGESSRKHRDINPDPVMIKSDGYPTYHFANVVDDHLMGITHIMRAQEWLPSGPLHQLLYRAFGWDPPHFCHLPMVMGKDGGKLSKRHGATALKDFVEKGYLPEAIVNYIALVGWAYDDKREFFTLKELEELFVLEKLSRSPGVFDYKKLEWFNGHYIRELSLEQLSDKVLPLLQKEGFLQNPPTEAETALLQQALPLIQERMKYLNDAVPMLRFLFEEVNEWNREEALPKKATAKQVIEALSSLNSFFADFVECTDEQNEEKLRHLAEEQGIKPAFLMQPLRVAATGTKISPPLVPSLRLLGVEESKKRVESFLDYLKKGE